MKLVPDTVRRAHRWSYAPMLPVAIVALSTPGLVFAPLVPGPTPSARPRVATTLTFRERGLAVSGTACDEVDPGVVEV